MRKLIVNSLITMMCLVASFQQAVAQQLAGPALLESLRKGGYVLVMRHASSPAALPDRATANRDNPSLERQLDAAGRAGATSMGRAIRALKIPLGDVVSSPAYRARETAARAQLSNVRGDAALGDNGQSMQGVTTAQAEWLRARSRQLPSRTNTLIVTHSPNIAKAFPEWGTVAEGETVVVGRNLEVVARIPIEAWSSLSLSR